MAERKKPNSDRLLTKIYEMAKKNSFKTTKFCKNVKLPLLSSSSVVALGQQGSIFAKNVNSLEYKYS